MNPTDGYPSPGRATRDIEAPPTVTGMLASIESLAGELHEMAVRLHRHPDSLTGERPPTEAVGRPSPMQTKELRPMEPAVTRLSEAWHRLVAVREVLADADARLSNSI